MGDIVGAIAVDRPVMAPSTRSVFTVLTAPLIYSLILPILLLDLWATIYQHICFRVYGVARVRRSDFVQLDRQMLPYLDAVGKVYCAYCGYSNGVIAYAREIASRSEQYWCPIKHATLPSDVHERYMTFADFGDQDDYLNKVDSLRDELRSEK